jgi:cellulose synthase/poly-beta-1,6-N-acetylglucosamine synthase-like glycosyltransferase
VESVVFIVDCFFLVFFVALNGSYTLLLLLSLADIWLRRRREVDRELHHALRSHYTPPVTVIAPAYNESLTIEASVRALLSLRYPEFEVVVVNDGSKDATVATMIEGAISATCPATALQQHPRVTVVLDSAAAADLKLVGYYNHVHPKGADSEFG